MSENVNADNSTNQVQPDVSQVNVADNSAPPSSADRMAFVMNMMTSGRASKTEGSEEPAPNAVQGDPAAQTEQEEQQAQEPVPDTAQSEPESQVEIPDKFKDAMGNLRVQEFLKSYVNMEALYSRQAQKMNELIKTVTSLQEQIAQFQAKQPGSSVEQTVSDEPTVEIDKEEFLEKFYEDPIKALQEWEAKQNSIKEQKRQAELARQEKARQEKVAFWQERIKECQQVYPDFDELRPVIQEVIAANRDWMENAPNAIETAYWMAKGITLSQTAPPEPVQPSVDDLLKDEKILEQIISNPEVQKNILSKHAQNVLNNPVPKIIGDHVGSTQPATAPTEIKSTKDAMQASKKYFERLFGGG